MHTQTCEHTAQLNREIQRAKTGRTLCRLALLPIFLNVVFFFFSENKAVLSAMLCSFFFLSSEHHCGLKATAVLVVPQISADMFSDVDPTPDGGHG